jgi:SNF family Na+-dependent transporter
MNSSFDMGFVALPNVFDAMWGGRIFGFMWFLMLFIAAIAASVSMLQPCIAFLEEGLGLKRHASVAILSLIAAIGCGFVLYFSKDAVALDTFDFWVGTFLIFMLAMFQTVLYGWIMGIDRGDKELHRGAHIRVPYLVQYVLKYVTPLYLLVIFVTFCYYNIKGRAGAVMDHPVALASICFILVILVFLLVLTHIAGRRWEKQGRLSGY